MARVVVVASAPVAREDLSSVVHEGDDLHVVVPAVEQSRLDWLTNDEDDARAAAEAVGEQIADDAPAETESLEVEPGPPAQAVRDAIAEHRPDRVVVALRDGEAATWLEEDELDGIPAEIDGVAITTLSLSGR